MFGVVHDRAVIADEVLEPLFKGDLRSYPLQRNLCKCEMACAVTVLSTKTPFLAPIK